MVGPFTVLAPTNESFEKLDPDLLQMLLQPENKAYLQEVLLYHILPGYFPSEELQAGAYETLLFGLNVEVAVDPIMFNVAGLVRPDTTACNGVIHLIDDVLIPPEPDFCDDFVFGRRRNLQDGGEACMANVLETAREDSDLSTVISLIEAADLTDVFDCAGPFTALLPENQAFESLDPAFLEILVDPANLDDLRELLLYHILPGATLSTEFTAGTTETLLVGETLDVGVSPLTFDEANVITSDIVGCNGYINKIETVLTPFPPPVPMPTEPPVIAPTPADICAQFTFERRIRILQDGGEECQDNVFEIAQADPNLQFVVSLLEIAGLEPVFGCAGAYSVCLDFKLLTLSLHSFS